MNKCKNCGIEITNPKFCSIKCRGKYYSGDRNVANRPEIRKFHREHNPMKNPIYLEQHKNIMKEVNNRVEVNVKRSESLKKSWTTERKKEQRKMMLENNPTNTIEVREKQKIAAIKQWKNLEYKEKYGAKPKEVHYCLNCKKETTNKKFCSNKCSNIFTNPFGINAKAYIDGRSFLPYCSKFNKKIKNEIRKRDNYQCQNPNCLCTQLESFSLWGASLHVHHIHYDKENCYPDLITLCNTCNLKANGNRKYHEKLYMNILNNRNLLFGLKET